MLDELGSERADDYIGGFPPHPHRGMQTLTYVLHGGLTHEDHLGHSSTIRAGDAQWMHTGRGIIHSEMPLTDSQGLHAFQLWINLAASEKMSAPTYRDVRATEMPRLGSLTEDARGSELTALGDAGSATMARPSRGRWMAWPARLAWPMSAWGR